jgi:hypothetical protein
MSAATQALRLRVSLVGGMLIIPRTHLHTEIAGNAPYFSGLMM